MSEVCHHTSADLIILISSWLDIWNRLQCCNTCHAILLLVFQMQVEYSTTHQVTILLRNFRTRNIRHLSNWRKNFNGENFPIYGTTPWSVITLVHSFHQKLNYTVPQTSFFLDSDLAKSLHKTARVTRLYSVACSNYTASFISNLQNTDFIHVHVYRW